VTPEAERWSEINRRRWAKATPADRKAHAEKISEAWTPARRARVAEEMRERNTGRKNGPHPRWRCDVCGIESNPMGITRHQRSSGHDGHCVTG
jgi:hypothetical protein